MLATDTSDSLSISLPLLVAAAVVALADDHVRALRLSQSIWQGHDQGENVVAEITPNLRFVRALRTDAASTPGQPIRSSG